MRSRCAAAAEHGEQQRDGQQEPAVHVERAHDLAVADQRRDRAGVQRGAGEHEDAEQRRVHPVHRALDAVEAQERRSRERAARSCVAPSGGIVVPSVGAADPAVDVVAAHFPVALFDVLGELDAVEPLQRLVAVHRRDVEAHRAAVHVGQRVALER